MVSRLCLSNTLVLSWFIIGRSEKSLKLGYSLKYVTLVFRLFRSRKLASLTEHLRLNKPTIAFGQETFFIVFCPFGCRFDFVANLMVDTTALHILSFEASWYILRAPSLYFRTLPPIAVRITNEPKRWVPCQVALERGAFRRPHGVSPTPPDMIVIPVMVYATQPLLLRGRIVSASGLYRFLVRGTRAVSRC